jgi:hypothetical protein
MTTIEIHFRLVTIRERIQQLQGELIVIGDDLRNEVSLSILGRAERKLHEAAEALQSVATANNPTAVLRASVKESEERRQCAATGADVLRFPGA